jgi:hypothetical protein
MALRQGLVSIFLKDDFGNEIPELHASLLGALKVDVIDAFSGSVRGLRIPLLRPFWLACLGRDTSLIVCPLVLTFRAPMRLESVRFDSASGGSTLQAELNLTSVGSSAVTVSFNGTQLPGSPFL